MSNKVRLGYIGLGNMGSPMATKMTEWPGGITVYDIRTEAMTPLAEKGASLADSVADVAVADIIHITVLDDAQVREVVRELAAHCQARNGHRDPLDHQRHHRCRTGPRTQTAGNSHCRRSRQRRRGCCRERRACDDGGRRPRGVRADQATAFQTLGVGGHPCR